MKKFEVIAFDIDSTLARSKQALEPEMAELISGLMRKYKVAIISGAGQEQFKWQVVDPLPKDPSILENLYLLPADGTIFCKFSGDWICDHDEPLPDAEKVRIRSAFDGIFEKSGLEAPEELYGELIEDRGAHMNFSALGQLAPLELKEQWDPDNLKRQRIVEELKKVIPEYSLHIGGTTSIEITRPGIDKSHGLKKLMERVGVSKQAVLYVGDKIFEGGNDYPALAMGLECRAVSGPEETKVVIRELLELNFE